jgi:hypothetical protein
MKKMIGIITIITLMACVACVASITLSIMEKDWTEVMAWVCVGLNVSLITIKNFKEINK